MPSFPKSSIKNWPAAGLRAAVALGAGAVALTAPAFGQGEAGADPSGQAPRVVATFYPLQITAMNVMGGLGEPGLLLEPTGGCAHGLALRPSEVRALGRAQIVVETGLGLEPFLEGGRLPLAGDVIRIPAAQLIADGDLIELAEAHDHGGAGHREAADGHATRTEAQLDEHGHEHEHGHGHEHEAAEAEGPAPLRRWEVREGYNGHAWSSPRLAGKMAQAIGEGLAEADPARAARYRRQGDAYAAELYGLAEELETAGAPLAGQRVVLTHTSLAYLARDLGLEVIATLHDEDENEPTARALARLIDTIREAMAAGDADEVTLLVDPQDRGRLAPLVAAEAGIRRVVTLDPAAAGPVEAGAYLATMRRNVETIRAWAEERSEGGALAKAKRADRPTGVAQR